MFSTNSCWNESIVRFGEAAANGAPGRQFIGQFKGEYLAWQNAVALLLQLLLVSRLIRYAGIRKSLFVMPCISLASYVTMVFAPVLGLVRDTESRGEFDRLLSSEHAPPGASGCPQRGKPSTRRRPP